MSEATLSQDIPAKTESIDWTVVWLDGSHGSTNVTNVGSMLWPTTNDDPFIEFYDTEGRPIAIALASMVRSVTKKV